MLKAVIPVAGLGTRLLSATKEQPKEMLPIFSRDRGVLCVKPIVQVIFEELFDIGIREFYFVVGRGKRAIEDHFSADLELINSLNGHGKEAQALVMEKFYKKVMQSTIIWVNQPEPRGFGDAVLRAEPLVGGLSYSFNEPFLVAAGDTYLTSKLYDIPSWLARTHENGQAEATLTLKEVDDPRQYGVAEAVGMTSDSLSVERVVEKPQHPSSKLAIMPLYVFNSSIFAALRNTRLDRHGEIQLTDAIQKLIDEGHKVQAIKLRNEDLHIDIGTPETYWQALRLSYGQTSERELLHAREAIASYRN
jgi:UTP--glucose-1-phosphate uridylyltransferase